LRFRKPSAAYFVAAWVLILSFLPLLYHLFIPHAWVGYGEGNYAYDNGRLHLEWAQVSLGANKPLIEAYPANTTGGTPINMVELSDKTSYVNGIGLFNSTFSTHVTNDTTLTTSYTASNLTMTKTVTVRGSQVFVTYSSPGPVQYEISFWHSYYDAVDGVTVKQLKGPACSQTKPVNGVIANFTMVSYGQQRYFGRFEVSMNSPSNILICGDATGINKFVLSTTARSVSFSITGEVGASSNLSPVTQLIAGLNESIAFQLAFPVLAVVEIFFWRRQLKSR
jgi:hypothetical protein